jgi:hypothetical protein
LFNKSNLNSYNIQDVPVLGKNNNMTIINDTLFQSSNFETPKSGNGNYLSFEKTDKFEKNKLSNTFYSTNCISASEKDLFNFERDSIQLDNLASRQSDKNTKNMNSDCLYSVTNINFNSESMKIYSKNLIKFVSPFLKISKNQRNESKTDLINLNNNYIDDSRKHSINLEKTKEINDSNMNKDLQLDFIIRNSEKS